MSDLQIDDPLFDYKAYRFGRTRQVFRGPQPDLRGAYLSFLGASHTFGRYTDLPFPTLIGEELGMVSLNLGTDGAGPGFFLGDPEVRQAASESSVCVVQVMSASSISNRMFSVRPRRNVRLHDVSELLRGIFPEVDFDRFAFVKPMLKQLHGIDPDRFKLVVNEMKNAWIGRTQTLLSSISAPKILFWFSQRAPNESSDDQDDRSGSGYPAFVDEAMIDTVKTSADSYVPCITSVGLPQDLTVDGRTVLYQPSGKPIDVNREFPSPEMHAAAAQSLLPAIRQLLGQI